MGWLDTVKQFFRTEQSGQVSQLARGASGEGSMPRMIPSANDSGMSGPYQQLATMLAIDSDLMLRYADYENMDDYPEVSCLAGESMIFTLADGWVAIRDLAERGEGFWVLAYDANLSSLVPAWATGARCTGAVGHEKPMVRVVIDDGRVITCTADHLFMTKGGEWVQAGDLGVGERLMPGAIRMRSLNADTAAPYWQVHQPQSDSVLRSSDGKRWMFLHRLVVEHGVELPAGAVVHHVNGDQLNNDPENLSVEDISSHAHHHIAGIDNSRYFPEWTPDRRAEMAERMRGNTYRRGTTCSAETRERMSESRRGQPKDARWRERIGLAQPNRIDIPEDRLEAALRDGGNVAEAARILGVSWSKVKRAAARADLLDAAANHRVLRVERIDDRPAVYDIEVPGLHNFVCDGVVVHNSALDIYADDATISDTVHGKMIWGVSKDKVIRDIINDLLDRRLRIEDEAWVSLRTLAKYGNLYSEVVVNEYGVLGLNWLPSPTMRRIVDMRGNLVGFVQDPTGAFAFQLSTKEDLEKLRNPTESNAATGNAVFFYPWEVVHWRLRGKQMRALYGYSILDSARWVWKRLLMLEDSALVMRLQKAPARFAFYIDTGDVPPREARAIVDDVRRRYKKKRIVDPATGKLDFRFNPMASDEDFFVPTRAGKDATRIDVLSGPDYDDTNVMSYFLKKLYSTLRIPPQYLGGTEVTNRAALTQEDVQFARLELRLQKEWLAGLRQVVRVHLASLNIDPDSVKWDLRMAAPSSIFEMQQIDVWNARAGLASALQSFFTSTWIMQNIFHMSDEDALSETEAKSNEMEQQALDQAQTQADIMQRFPELASSGMLPPPVSAPPTGMEAGVAPLPQQAGNEDISRKLDRLLSEVKSEQQHVERTLRRIEPSVQQLNRRLPDVIRMGQRMRMGTK